MRPFIWSVPQLILVLASRRPVPSSWCGLPEAMTIWLYLCHHLSGPRRNSWPELGQSDSLHRFLELEWEKQVSRLQEVKLAGEPTSSEAATLYSTDLRKTECCLQKERPEESWREPWVFPLSSFLQPSCPGGRTPGVPAIENSVLLLAGVSCCSLVVGLLHIMWPHWGNEHWSFQKSEDGRYITYKLF